MSFLTECGNTFYISQDDIVSVHRDTPNLVSSPSIPTSDIYGHQSSVLGSDVSVNTGKLPFISNSSYIGLTTIQALQRFSRYFNKNSVIGKRISSYLKVHYGASVANSLFKDANHIGTYSFPLSVDDVMSTSDTFQTTSDTSSGEMLGAYAGKGIGFDKSSFDFTAPTFGYFFVLSSISTPIGYFQGNSGDLYVTDFDSVPTPDYDALGFEVSPRGQFIGYNDCYSPLAQGSQSSKLSDGFGFVPRYTGLKYHKNIVNGDISRRSTSSSLSAYHLNRIITPFSYRQKQFSAVSTTDRTHILDVEFSFAKVPSASTEWRYLSKASWLGDYDRIFYNAGDIFPSRYSSLQRFGIDDNFIVQSVFDVKVTNQYKPLSESWDTYEESTDNSSIDVRPE